ncbi:NAD(P)-binding protein [Aspergillus steynii IBT 23096]|uniref:NAD(P)-binding protein n=1 Tax=Aspergillus steynii IBT 23096 TaxID=1392250 RepID=A0A2I2G029_9EURO|nr:NAD(P)-binding protein [Aspergillus steynii IBT 23096]PLB46252.1 NAD(P)-binding protein [Aspergillus steynii IBT 23096]
MSLPHLQPTIPLGSWILVTGANGFIASHIINLLLSSGYRVRGTVREPKPWLDEFFADRHGQDKYQSVVVPGLEVDGALDEYLGDVRGVLHVASDISYNPDPQVVIPKVLAATLNTLKAAAKAHGVKRVVLTSSVVAAFPNSVDGTNSILDTWNDAAVKAAWDPNTPDAIKSAVTYAASKVVAEQAAWKWVEENKPRFQLNTILTNFNFGSTYLPQLRRSSMRLTQNLLQGDDLVMKLIPRQWRVDVDDTARLHAIAVLHPGVVSERVFAASEPFSWARVVEILRRLRPQNKSIPDAPEEAEKIFYVVPSQRAEDLIKEFYGRPGWTTLEESLEAGIEGLE